MTIEINLTWPEIGCALREANDRQVSVWERGIRNPKAAKYDFFESMSIAMYGIIAELAVCRAFNIYPSTLMGQKSPDVGFFGEVKGVIRRHYNLLIPKDGIPVKIAILVYVNPNEPTQCELMGWEYMDKVMVQDNLTEPQKDRPAYKVLQENLHPMSEIDPVIEKYRYAFTVVGKLKEAA